MRPNYLIFALLFSALFAAKLNAQDCRDTLFANQQLDYLYKNGPRMSFGDLFQVLDTIEASFANCSVAVHPTRADARRIKASILANSRQLVEAEKMIRLAIADYFILETADGLNSLRCNQSLGQILRRQGRHFETIRLLRATDGKLRQREEKAARKIRVDLLNILALAYKGVNLFDQSLRVFQETRKVAEDVYPAEHSIFIDIVNNTANVYGRLGDYSQSISLHKEALGMLRNKSRPDTSLIARSLHNLGAQYRNLSQHARANTYFSEAISLRDAIGENLNASQARSYSMRGLTYGSQKRFTSALEDLKKSQAIQKKLPNKNDLFFIFDLSALAQLHLEFNELEKAEPLLRIVDSLGQQRMQAADKTMGDSYLFNQLGVLMSYLDKADKSVEYYQAALAIQQQLPGVADAELANTHGNIASAYYATGALDTGYYHANASLKLSHWSEDPLDYFQDGISTEPYTSVHAAKLAIAIYDRDGNRELLLRERERMAFSLKIMDTYARFGELYSPEFVAGHGKIVLAVAAEMDWRLSQKPEERAYYHRSIVELSERAKGYFQLQQLHQNSAMSLLPDSLALQEKELRGEVARAQIALSEARRQTGASPVRLAQLSATARNAQTSLLKLQRSLIDQYKLMGSIPDTTMSVRAMQTSLTGTSSAYFSYFRTAESVFLNLVRPDTFLVARVRGVDETRQSSTLDAFINNLIDSTGRNPGEDAALFCSLAHELYQHLLAPLADHFPEHLIVIPDPVFGTFPVEVLLTEEVKKEALGLVHAYPYLIHNHTISYSTNAALYSLAMSSEKRADWSEKAVVMAPFSEAPFIDDRKVGIGRHGVIPSSREEALEVAKLLSTEALLGDRATEAALTKQAPSAPLIHLSTHGLWALAGEAVTALLFAPRVDNLENEVLYLREIYEMPLSAELVTLSACGTGAGRYVQGEGALSVSRAFVIAGARSVLATQWSVRGPETEELMGYFYEELMKGTERARALRNAKLMMLSEREGFAAHPYFWAGAIMSGATGPLR